MSLGESDTECWESQLSADLGLISWITWTRGGWLMLTYSDFFFSKMSHNMVVKFILQQMNTTTSWVITPLHTVFESWWERGILGMVYPQPQLCLLLALQAQHDGLPSHRNDLQFVLFSLQLLLLVDHTAAQQTHIQQRRLLLGALIALREAEITLT